MMSLTSAFDDLQAEVNVKDRNDRKARDRRDVFKAAFNPQAREDVERVLRNRDGLDEPENNQDPGRHYRIY